MATLISSVIEETLEEAYGHDADFHLYRSAVQQRLEDALTNPPRKDRQPPDQRERASQA